MLFGLARKRSSWPVPDRTIFPVSKNITTVCDRQCFIGILLNQSTVVPCFWISWMISKISWMKIEPAHWWLVQEQELRSRHARPISQHLLTTWKGRKYLVFTPSRRGNERRPFEIGFWFSFTIFLKKSSHLRCSQDKQNLGKYGAPSGTCESPCSHNLEQALLNHYLKIQSFQHLGEPEIVRRMVSFTQHHWHR